MEIKIPYDKRYLTLELPESRINGILEAKISRFKSKEDARELINKTLDNPIGSKPLEELAEGKKNIVIITSDHTRPVPSKTTIPILLERIRKANPSADITILIATGFHRPTTYEEMVDKFGEEIVKNEKIVNHDCKDKENMAFFGLLPSGGELWLNSYVKKADLLIAEGFIEPHFFAGFSGGRKSILPGIAGETTVLANHCSKFIAHDCARTGILKNNPIHKDMVYAAQKANLQFILNVVINGKKEIIKAFSGDCFQAHQKGCDFVSELCEVKPVFSDVVITSNGGYPLDQNIYQAVKGMTAAEACLKDKGVIIMISSCRDGHGGDGFYNWFKNSDSIDDIINQIEAIPSNKTMADQWEAQILARVLKKHTVIMVAEKHVKEYIENMFMIYSETLDDALNKAYEIAGRGARFTVIPDGVSIIIRED